MTAIQRITTKNDYWIKCLCNRVKCLKFLKSFIICIVISVIFLSSLTDAFNVDTATALVQRGPSGTHFGFSVSQHKDRGVSWLLVGAPLAHTDQPQVDRGGAVYRCSVDSSDACQQIAFDRSGSGHISLRGKQEQTDEKSNQWFGASVHSAGENGMIVACAPRYVYYSTSLKRRDPVGTCWISRGSFTGFFEYSPCRTTAWGYHRQGSCQAGFSASVTKDGRHLYIGAVGSWYWQGQAFSQDLLETQTLFSTREAPAYDDDSFLGYSTTVGEFTGDNDFDVAIGMPKGSNLTGKVVLYTSTLRNIYNITGDQMGAYFGYCLTTADIDGDGLDDVIIGAPLYSPPNAKDQSYEKGRIYIAYQTREFGVHQFPIKDHIDGIKSKARFGMSLAFLGDINKDGFDDIAVGAPYDGEKGSGAVYIYLGGKKGLQEKFAQVIHAESINDPGLKTFGFSLSGGLDLDNNQYPDLLVGAYASDRAIFLKARPVVNMTAVLTLGKESVSLDDKDCNLVDGSRVPCVTIKLCLQYNGVGVENKLDFIYETILDADLRRAPRIFFLHKEREHEERISVSLNKGSQYCTSRQAYLAVSLTIDADSTTVEPVYNEQSTLRDKLTPIKVSVEYSLSDTPGQRILKPVINQAVSNVMTRQINIRKNCGSDNICIPDLSLTVRNNADSNEYIVGSRKKIELIVTVLNKGEDAFESTLYLFMPTDVNYVNINKSKNSEVGCYGAQPDKTGDNNLKCDIGNPLPKGKKTEFTIIMEPSKTISATSSDYTFIILVNSTNAENATDLQDNNDTIGIALKVEVNLTIYGVSKPDVLSFNATAETFKSPKQVLEDIGREISHSYTIQNTGPSTIKKAEVTILWPTRDLRGNYLLYLVHQPVVEGKGFCKSITLDDLNPRRLKPKKVNDGRSPTDGRSPPDSQPSTHAEHSYVETHNSYSISSRTKREFPMQSNKHRITDSAAIERLKSCGTTNCTKIICTVYELKANETVLFRIHSRFWKDTIEFINLEEFKISSKLVALVTSLPYDVDHSLLLPYTQTVSTKFYVTGLDKSEPISLWIIILAIIIGLLILGGLALALWKLGFFKRKRPPSDSADREPLQSRNGYNYRKGDTSL